MFFSPLKERDKIRSYAFRVTACSDSHAYLVLSAMSKRSASPSPTSSSSGGALIKRAKSSSDGPSTSREIAISSNNDPRNKALIRSVQRTSGLDAPIISLAGAHAVSLSLSGNSILIVFVGRNLFVSFRSFRSKYCRVLWRSFCISMADVRPTYKLWLIVQSG